MSRKRAGVLTVGVLLAAGLIGTRRGDEFGVETPVAGSPPAAVTPAPLGPPPGYDEEELREGRERWFAELHRAPPGVDWRAVEAVSSRRAIAERARWSRAQAARPLAKRIQPWRERGPSNQTGRTWVTARRPDGSLLIGTDGGGLWSGWAFDRSWQPRSDGLGFRVRNVVVVPSSPERWTITAGRSELPFTTTDGGATWVASTLPAGGASNLQGFLQDHGDPRIIWAWWESGGCRLLRSTDGGVSFVELRRGPGGARCSFWQDPLRGGPLFLLESEKLLVSTDGGTTFTLRGTLPATGLTTWDLRLAGSGAGAPALYATTRVEGDDHWKLWGSNDAGASWEERTHVTDYWGTLEASQLDPNLLFVGGVDAYRSPDGGRTLTAINRWYEYYGQPDTKLHADLPGIDCLVTDGRESCYFDTDGGTFATEDGGLSVKNVTRYGLGDGQFYDLHTSSRNPDRIAAGAQDQGYQVSTPAAGGSLQFEQVISGDYGHYASPDGTHDRLYQTYPGFAMVQSGETAPNRRLTLIDFPTGRRGWLPMVIADPDNRDRAYLAGDRIAQLDFDPRAYRGSWSFPFAQDFGAGDDQDYITALAISPANHERWFAASSKGRFWRSSDRGVTWTESAVRIAQSHYFYGTALLCAPHDESVCYAGGAYYGNSGVPVLVTRDGGETWTPMSTGLPRTTVLGLDFDSPASQVIYAATEAGPYVFDAAAGTWRSLYGTGAPITTYWGVEGVPAKGVVRFATYGRGIWDYAPNPVCEADDASLCLLANRFSVEVEWENQFNGQRGRGIAIPSTDLSGFFAFTDRSNVELIVKLLPLEDHVKVFYGQLTNLHFTLRVTDARTRETKTYTNTEGECGAIDDLAFPKALLTGGSCVADRDTLCLLGKRMAIEVDWKNQYDGSSGKGTPRSLSDLTGVFTFTSGDNVELMAKALDFGDRTLLFFGSLSNLEHTIRARDTVTGIERSYYNPPGRFCGTIDDDFGAP